MNKKIANILLLLIGGVVVVPMPVMATTEYTAECSGLGQFLQSSSKIDPCSFINTVDTLLTSSTLAPPQPFQTLTQGTYTPTSSATDTGSGGSGSTPGTILQEPSKPWSG